MSNIVADFLFKLQHQKGKKLQMSLNPQHSQENSQPRHGAFLMIFAFVADDHDLDDSAKMLYGRLTALAEREGYCYASDKYLCEICNQEIRSLQRRLQQLEEKGYIRRETVKKGVLWERKIFITNLTNSKNVYEASPMTSRSVTHDVSNGHQWRNNKISKNIDKKEKDKAAAPPSELALGLSSHLLKKIKEIHPKQKDPKLVDWAKHIDLMLSVDKRTEDEIRKAIDWAIESSFWRGNIRSTKKLRDHFDTLCIQMKSSEKSSESGGSQKKAKLTPFEELCQTFKGGEVYNGATCYLNPQAIAFSRGMKHEQIEINQFFSWEKFAKMCESFGIKFERIKT